MSILVGFVLVFWVVFFDSIFKDILERRAQKMQAQELERLQFLRERQEEEKIEMQIAKYEDELDNLYYQRDLYCKLESVQKIDTNNKYISESDLKKQIQTQKQIANLNKQISKLENAIANLNAN